MSSAPDAAVYLVYLGCSMPMLYPPSSDADGFLDALYRDFFYYNFIYAATIKIAQQRTTIRSSSKLSHCKKQQEVQKNGKLPASKGKQQMHCVENPLKKSKIAKIYRW